MKINLNRFIKTSFIFGISLCCIIIFFTTIESNAAFWGRKTVDKKECAKEYRENCSKRCNSVMDEKDKIKCLENCEENLGKECGYSRIENIRREPHPKIQQRLY